MITVGVYETWTCDQWHLLHQLPRFQALPSPETPHYRLLDDGNVPDEAETNHPGLTTFVEGLPVRWRGHEQPPDRWWEYVRGPREHTTLQRMADGAAAAHPDEIVLVPVRRSELSMLQQVFATSRVETPAHERVIRLLALDLVMRAQGLVAADPDHAEHVVSEWSRAVRLLTWLQLWWPNVRGTDPFAARQNGEPSGDEGSG